MKTSENLRDVLRAGIVAKNLKNQFFEYHINRSELGLYMTFDYHLRKILQMQ